jgi:phosphoenolpyruvate synthase/pyruvate phosphate dikinase
MEHVLCWLGQPDCMDQLRVGGKVAHLSRLAAAHRVPPGFCLTTAAYEQSGQSISPALRDMIAVAYRELAERCADPAPRVAVRSSAVDEDGGRASFAGQHETYLHLAGLDEIVDAVARCWASASSERALAYRRQQAVAMNHNRFAVLVQQLIAADVAAVIFSAHPVSGRRDQVLINASWGLGESIVGGTTTPDVYVVDVATMQIVSRQLGTKERLTITTPGGTREVDTPGLLRSQYCLGDAQIIELARLGVDLEAEMGWPVDIECAYQDASLFLLQCRPITTL